MIGPLASLVSCRLHGRGCRVPWGYDPVHTDSRRPYTLDELAARETPPHRYAYPNGSEYELGFYTWRALRWDSQLSAEEAWEVDRVRLARIGIHADSMDDALRQRGLL